MIRAEDMMKQKDGVGHSLTSVQQTKHGHPISEDIVTPPHDGMQTRTEVRRSSKELTRVDQSTTIEESYATTSQDELALSGFCECLFASGQSS